VLLLLVGAGAGLLLLVVGLMSCLPVTEKHEHVGALLPAPVIVMLNRVWLLLASQDGGFHASASRADRQKGCKQNKCQSTSIWRAGWQHTYRQIPLLQLIRWTHAHPEN
jgi:hypothetical protein